MTFAFCIFTFFHYSMLSLGFRTMQLTFCLLIIMHVETLRIFIAIRPEYAHHGVRIQV